MPLYLTEADVAATFTMTDALRVLDAATRNIADGSAMNAPPQRVSAGGAILQVLPAALDGRTGHTSYTVGSRGATFWVTLFAPDGAMLALIEANTLGQIRTGAASGLATRHLARADAVHRHHRNRFPSTHADRSDLSGTADRAGPRLGPRSRAPALLLRRL